MYPKRRSLKRSAPCLQRLLSLRLWKADAITVRATEGERLLARVWERLREYAMEKPLSEFLQRFLPTTKAYLVGGFLRDLVRADMSGVATLPKDIDLIIDTYDLEANLKAMPGYLSGTPLGGYRWKPKGTTFWFDIWQLQDP